MSPVIFKKSPFFEEGLFYFWLRSRSRSRFFFRALFLILFPRSKKLVTKIFKQHHQSKRKTPHFTHSTPLFILVIEDFDLIYQTPKTPLKPSLNHKYHRTLYSKSQIIDFAHLNQSNPLHKTST